MRSTRESASRGEFACSVVLEPSWPVFTGFDLPARVIREQMASAFQLIMQIARHSDGARRVTKITELAGIEGETAALEDVFVYERSPYAGDGTVRGELRWKGLRPGFTDRFSRFGVPDPLTGPASF